MEHKTVDSERLQANGEHVTGIYVRAKHKGRWLSADIANLDRESLLSWLRTGGVNPLAENLVGILLGYGHIHQASAYQRDAIDSRDAEIERLKRLSEVTNKIHLNAIYELGCALYDADVLKHEIERLKVTIENQRLAYLSRKLKEYPPYPNGWTKEEYEDYLEECLK